MTKQVYVLLYSVGKDSEGIHSLELAGKTIVLMFENKDDADRYCGLLEAQDFPCPSVVSIDREEIEIFCTQSGYENRFVEAGFVPENDEDRLLLVPPQQNRETSYSQQKEEDKDEGLDDFRRSLEGLI
ncbi:DUF3110 domain-containing protein [Prochlorococcus sp. MIT 1307]|uniref:DUF3110 domain-containing protein n=1 Tax=Prochlorococcus sp. MIT 1307 TaxID=3096219 RepID=UPI002A74E03B|nr:DUF3110 domain-containing protein [Prochlorococcus sp. MIT 1307]